MTDLPARRTTNTAARVFTILAFVFAALALFFFPPIFGLLAVVLGLIGGFMGDRPLGWYAAGAGVVAAIIGMILGAVVFSATQ